MATNTTPPSSNGNHYSKLLPCEPVSSALATFARTTHGRGPSGGISLCMSKGDIPVVRPSPLVHCKYDAWRHNRGKSAINGPASQTQSVLVLIGQPRLGGAWGPPYLPTSPPPYSPVIYSVSPCQWPQPLYGIDTLQGPQAVTTHTKT